MYLPKCTDTCSEGKKFLFEYFEMRASECSDTYWMGIEDTRHYNDSWMNPLHAAPSPPTQYTYQSSWNLKTITLNGNLGTYSGGGYVLTMPVDPDLHIGKH